MPYNATVAAQQTALNKQGANLKVDGISGPLTQAAAIKYSTPTPAPAPVSGGGGGSSPTIYAGGLAPNDPKNQYNTQTGQPNPNWVGNTPPPVTTPTQYAGGKPPNDPSNQYNTATGQINTNYVNYQPPAPPPDPQKLGNDFVNNEWSGIQSGIQNKGGNVDTYLTGLFNAQPTWNQPMKDAVAQSVKQKYSSSPAPLLQQGTGNVAYPNEAVRAIQTQLGIKADGIFGLQTKSAVLNFQQQNGLVQDGIVGPLTAAALKKAASGVVTPEPKTTSPTTTTATTKAPDDSGNQFNTATGAPNPKWINPATGKNTLQETTEINTTANADIEKMLAGFKNTLGTNVDVSDSSKLVKAITDSLSAPQAPKVSLVDTLNTKRAELGVGAKETELSSIDSEIAKLDANNKFLQEDNDNRVQSMSQINRRKSADQIIYEKTKSDLTLKRNSVVNELNMKYGVIDSIMKYTSADYENAQQDYTTKFNQAISLTNILKGIEETNKSDAEKKVDNARANVQVMMTTLKDKNIDFSTLSASTLLDIKNLEIQAGLPVGFTKFALSAVDEPVVSIGSEYVNSAGNRITPIYTKNPSTGVVSVKTITLPGGTQTSSGDSTKNQADDIASAVLNFRDIMKAKNQAGIDPTIYDGLVAILKKKYGADAVLKLEKAVADASMFVDR